MSAVASYFPVDYEAKMVARARLSRLVAESFPSEVSVTEHVALGSIYDAILRTEEKIDADLIVVASARAEGLPDWTQRRARGAAFETLRLRRARVDVSQVHVDALDTGGSAGAFGVRPARQGEATEIRRSGRRVALMNSPRPGGKREAPLGAYIEIEFGRASQGLIIRRGPDVGRDGCLEHSKFDALVAEKPTK